MVCRLLDLGVMGEVYHKIQIISCTGHKLHLIMELVHRLRNVPRFSEVGGI